MLDKLGANGYRLFDVILVSEAQLLISDSHDMYQSVRLQKNEVIELANDFLKLAERMK